MYHLTLLLSCGTLLFLGASGELYSSVMDLRELVNSEEALTGFLDKYIALQEQRLSKIREIGDKFAEDVGDEEAYISNPINIFLLIKKMKREWDKLEELLKEEDVLQEAEKNIRILEEEKLFPDQEDLVAASHALLRVQHVYDLDTPSIANGTLLSHQSRLQLTAWDCTYLARICQSDWSKVRSCTWFQEALNRLKGQTDIMPITRPFLLQMLAANLFELGNITKGYKLVQEILEEEPKNKWALEAKADYKSRKDFKVEMKPSMDVFHSEVLEQYELLCKRNYTTRLHAAANLKCRYIHNDNPFLRLARFKEEELSNEPRVVMFRNVVHDSEIEVLKNFSLSRLLRATVLLTENQGRPSPTDIRIAKTAWLYDHDHPVMSGLTRRFADLADLSYETSEPFQVVNYGLGGHYLPHPDYFVEGRDDLLIGERGNRIATTLLYMTDVQEGGATAFTSMQAAAWPKKGSVVFWYNLLPDGDADTRTIHGACPVLVGNKWVANKWFRLKGQNQVCPPNRMQVPKITGGTGTCGG